MKIWFPTIRSGSGSDLYTIRLADALRKHGFDVTITWFPHHYELAPWLLSAIKPPSGTDIIHTNSWSGFAFKRKSLPLVVTEHHCVMDPGYRSHETLLQHLYHRLLIQQYEHRSVRLASTVIAVSNFTAESIRRVFHLDGVSTIYNWVDTTTFQPAPQTTSPNNRFQLLFVGNLSIRKGADLLPHIMTRLGPEFELRYSAGLRAGRMQQTPPNMIPLGHLSDKALVTAYQECDALLFPSRFEGFGYAAVEAMACGKPVITSDNTSLREIVVPGETGFLCPTNDEDAFVQACRQLAENPTLCESYGRNGLARVRRFFSEETIIPQYIDFYSSLSEK